MQSSKFRSPQASNKQNYLELVIYCPTFWEHHYNSLLENHFNVLLNFADSICKASSWQSKHLDLFDLKDKLRNSLSSRQDPCLQLLQSCMLYRIGQILRGLLIMTDSRYRPLAYAVQYCVFGLIFQSCCAEASSTD